MDLPEPPLLVISDRHQARRPLIEVAQKAFAGGCRWFSLREKDLPTDERRDLLAALVERAQDLGYHKLVLAAFPSNAAGMRLYERHQFRTVGIYHEQGMLDGRWVDVVIMERLLA